MKKTLLIIIMLLSMNSYARWNLFRSSAPLRFATVSSYVVHQINLYGQIVTTPPCILPASSCVGIFQNIPTTMVINGSGFKNGSYVELTDVNGNFIEKLPTTFVNSTQVVANFTSPIVPNGTPVNYGVKVVLPR